jgi:hypothetical protein
MNPSHLNEVIMLYTPLRSVPRMITSTHLRFLGLAIWLFDRTRLNGMIMVLAGSFHGRGSFGHPCPSTPSQQDPGALFRTVKGKRVTQGPQGF